MAIATVDPPPLAPRTLAELRELLARATGARTPLLPRGLGTRSVRDPRGRTAVTTRALPAELDLDAEEMVLSASAATPLADLEPALRAAGLYLAPLCLPDFEMPHGTLGGLYSDPREPASYPRFGRVRDHVLGIEGVRGDGVPFKAGGRVVKNVTGYDLTRLLCGARGRLAVITRLHWRLLPRPEVWQQAVCKFSDYASLWRALVLLRSQPHEPDAIAVEPTTARLTIVVSGRAELAPLRLERMLAAAGIRDGATSPLTPEGAGGAAGWDGDDSIIVRIHAPFHLWETLPAALASQVPTIGWIATHPAAHFGRATVPRAGFDRATLERLRVVGAACGVTLETLPCADLDDATAFAESQPPFAASLRAALDPAGVLG